MSSGSQSVGQAITVADTVNAAMTASQADISVSPAAMSGFSIGVPSNIAAGTAIPAVHTVELLDWATGGPKPAALP